MNSFLRLSVVAVTLISASLSSFAQKKPVVTDRPHERAEYVTKTYYPGTEAPVNSLIVAAAAREQLRGQVNGRTVAGNHFVGVDPAAWQELGPGDWAGRITALAVHPTNPNVIFVGAPQGGMWKSSNRGATWQPVNSVLPALAITAIEFSKTSPQTLYAGTGFKHQSVQGNGVLKSVDGGTTWVQLAATLSPEFTWQAIIDLAVSPTNANHLVVATVNSIFRSIDGGISWTNENPSGFKKVCDIEYHPSNALRLVAGAGSTTKCATVEGTKEHFLRCAEA